MPYSILIVHLKQAVPPLQDTYDVTIEGDLPENVTNQQLFNVLPEDIRRGAQPHGGTQLARSIANKVGENEREHHFILLIKKAQARRRHRGGARGGVRGGVRRGVRRGARGARADMRDEDDVEGVWDLQGLLAELAIPARREQIVINLGEGRANNVGGNGVGIAGLGGISITQIIRSALHSPGLANCFNNNNQAAANVAQAAAGQAHAAAGQAELGEDDVRRIAHVVESSIPQDNGAPGGAAQEVPANEPALEGAENEMMIALWREAMEIVRLTTEPSRGTLRQALTLLLGRMIVEYRRLLWAHRDRQLAKEARDAGKEILKILKRE